MSTRTGYSVIQDKNEDYQAGMALVKAVKIQKALNVARNASECAKRKGDWASFAYHVFYCGRLVQGLHQLKDKYDLDIDIPDPTWSDLPNFISQRTRDDFPEVR